MWLRHCWSHSYELSFVRSDYHRSNDLPLAHALLQFEWRFIAIHNVRSIRSMMKSLHLLSFPDWVLEILFSFFLPCCYHGMFFFLFILIRFAIVMDAVLSIAILTHSFDSIWLDCEKCSFLNLIDILRVLFYSAIECYSSICACQFVLCHDHRRSTKWSEYICPSRR